MKQYALSDVVIEELSLVDSPANKSSRAVLMKRDAAGSALGRIAKKLGFGALLKNDDELDPNPIALLKAEDDEDEDEEDLDEEDLDEDEDEDEELDEDELAELEKEMDEIEKSLDEEDPNNEDVTMRGGLAKADITAVMSAIQKRDEQISKLEKEIETLKKSSEHSALIKKANSLVGAAPVQTEVVASLLSKLDDEGQEQFASLMKSFSEVSAESALFDSLSRVSDLSDDGRDVLEKRITELRKSDASLTYEQAFTKALSESPEVYDDIDDADEA